MLSRISIPKEAKPIPLRPLALGEKTGHHHSLAVADGADSEIEDLARMYETPSVEGSSRRTFLQVIGDGVVLTHQEHKSQAVPVGEYEVTIQTEVTDWGRSQIAD